MTWGEVKEQLIAAGVGAVKRDPLAMELNARLTALQNEIDFRLVARRARAEGLDSDPAFKTSVGQYAKTSLINLNRGRLAKEMEPTEEQLHAYFDANRSAISTPEFRKVQMVMLKTEDEARALKKRIDAGELTLYQAAANLSVAPDAKKNLGEIGWIVEGRMRPALDAVIFTLKPGEVGGPVEAGGLWHLISVQDVGDAQYTDFDDNATRNYVRRKYIHAKLDRYVVDLRKNHFPVTAYEDKLIQLAQKEADRVKTLAAESQDPSSVTQKRIQEMQKLLQH